MAAGGTVPAKFREWFGYEYRVVGTDLVVDDNDPILQAGPQDVLFARDQSWVATKDTYARVIEEFLSDYLNREFDGVPQRKFDPIGVDSQYGIKTDIEHAKLRFFLTKTRGLANTLEKDVFPLFCERLELRNIHPVKLAAVEYQKRLALLKIPLLVREFGIEGSKKAIFENNALQSVMPNSVEAMSYVDGLLTFGLQAFALPLHRMGCSLYFRGQGFCGFSRLGLENNFEQLMMSPGALVNDTSAVATYLKVGLGNRGYDSMVKIAVLAINSLLRFLNDPRRHMKKGHWDPKAQIQAHANFRLIMTDIQTTNFSASAYLRQKLSLSVLDRIANAWKAYAELKNEESELFQCLLSSSTSSIVQHVLRDSFASVSQTASKGIAKSARFAHRDMHEAIRLQMGSGTNEQERLESLRVLRNANHGVYLTRGQFEKTFLKRPLALPKELEAYVYFLVWAICFQPLAFLNRRP